MIKFKNKKGKIVMVITDTGDSPYYFEKPLDNEDDDTIENAIKAFGKVKQKRKMEEE